MSELRFKHLMSGLQPSAVFGCITQPCGLGWDDAAPLALVWRLG